MDAQLIKPWTQRRFLGRLTAASAAGLLGLRPGIAAAAPTWFAMVFAYIGLDPEESLHDLDEFIGEGNAS